MSLLRLGLGPITILVTGSRDYHEKETIREILTHLAAGHTLVTLWHGKCNPMLAGEFVKWEWALNHPNHAYLGADWLAEEIASEEGWATKHFPADWSKGRGAGPQRNAKMVAGKPDVVAGFRNGNSRGTIGCLEMALRAGLPLIAP